MAMAMKVISNIGSTLRSLRWGSRVVRWFSLCSEDRWWGRAFLVSAVLHIALIAALAVWTVSRDRCETLDSIAGRWTSTSSPRVSWLPNVSVAPIRQGRTESGHSDAVASAAADLRIPPMTIASVPVAGAPGWLPGPSSWRELAEPVGEQAAVAEEASGPDGEIDSDSDTRSSSVAGRGSGEGAGTFFGFRPSGRRVVFLLDASRSMNHPYPGPAQTRFKCVKLELVRAVAAMDSESQFFIIFFNDQAIPMPAPGLEPASRAAQHKFLYWAQTVVADGETDPTAAFAIALALQPDELIFLTDGWFPKTVSDALLAADTGATVIHTFSFEPEITPQVQQAKDLVRAGRVREARRRFGSKVTRRALQLAEAERLLVDLARRTGGQYHRIP